MVLLMLVGCATNPTNPQDPYEGFNRKVFTFNEVADKYAILPVVRGYDDITPDVVQTSINNVFSNLGDIPTVGNDLLQGHVGWAIADTWRFIFNTTIGIGGIFDVASHFGLKDRNQDFGLTLAKWGAKKSPYIVFPFLGPMTVRDGVGAFSEYMLMTVYPLIRPYYIRWGVLSFYYVHLRAELLPAQDLIEQAFDPYVFVRDAYLQRREYLIEQNEGITPKNGDEYVNGTSNGSAAHQETESDPDLYVEE